MILPSGWSYFVYTFLPQHSTFTGDDLLHHPSFSTRKSQNLLKKFKFVLRAYTRVQSILQVSHFGRRPVFGWICPLAQPYLVGYFLAKLWERDFKDEGSVITESIVNHNVAPALGVKVEAWEQLNALEAYGIIEQRRAVPPFR